MLEGDEWFLLLLDDSARLFRYAGGGTYECRFLGPLYGGTYTESYSWRDEAPHLRLEFEHERVKLELELQADKKMSEADQTVREAFRRWASKPV